MELTKREAKDLKNGNAKILKCAHCGKDSFFGALGLISLAISRHKPVCSYECNKLVNKI